MNKGNTFKAFGGPNFSFKKNTTNQAAPAANTNQAAKPSFGFKPKTNFATTATPPSSAAPAPPANQLIGTAGTQFQPTQVNIQESNGSASQGNSMSIFAKLNQLTPLELRVNDYILKKKVDQLQPPPPPPQAPQNQPTETAFNPKNALSILNTKMTTSTNKSKTSGPIKIENKNIEEDGLTAKDIEAAEGLPNTIPAKIYTAAEFFKPNIPKLKKAQISESSFKTDEQKPLTDYSILFRSQAAPSHRSKSVVTPIIITSKMLNCHHEEEPSTLTFAPSYDENQNDDIINIHKEEDIPVPSSNIVTSDELTIYPPLKKIHTFSSIKNFRISKESIATIDFLSPVDISNFNFKKDVLIRTCLVDVYRVKRSLPKKGTGMNVEAMINMHSTWPKNLTSGKREKIFDKNLLTQYENKLKTYCQSKNAKFVLYIKDKGIFQFIVPDFSNGPFDLP